MNQADLAARIRGLAFVSLLAFCVMPFYVSYWAVLRGADLRSHPLNGRGEARLAKTKPGRLLAAEGEVILDRRMSARRTWERTYPSPRTYCHLTGYNARTGLQLSLREYLLKPAPPHDLLAFLSHPEPVGSDVRLTVVERAQALARERLEGQQGAVVAINPQTGAILVLASAPTFDPVQITKSEESWTLFSTDPASPGLNRAVQGLYPPGSIFKLVTAAAALENGVVSMDTEYTCEGSVKIGGHELHCWRKGGHGTLNLAGAVAQSCNVYFAHLGEAVGARALYKYAETTGLFAKPELPLPEGTLAVSRLEPRQDDDLASASYGLGQGDLLITPFSAAQLAAAIANQGRLMKPQLIQAVISPDGRVHDSSSPTIGIQAFRKTTAQLLAGMMEAAVESGTGRAAKLPHIRVAGKTGSAQTPTGSAHAWFIGFAPAQGARVAVAVVIEHGGSGGAVAAPIARDIIEELLR